VTSRFFYSIGLKTISNEWILVYERIWTLPRNQTGVAPGG